MPFPVNCPDLESHKEDCPPNKTFSMRAVRHSHNKNPSTLFLAAGEQIAGIVYQPESLQGMRENLERVLQFMASKKIRMHAITSKEVLEGNLKAVMRLILALAAHYKPQSVKHHDVSYEQMPEVKSAGASKPEASATNSKFLRLPSSSFLPLAAEISHGRLCLVCRAIASSHFLCKVSKSSADRQADFLPQIIGCNFEAGRTALGVA